MTFFGLFAVAFLESLAVGWFYDTEALRRKINEHSLVNIGGWWNVTVKFVVPLAAFVLLVISVISVIKAPYGGYPRTAELIGGWIPLALALVAGILLGKATARTLSQG